MNIKILGIAMAALSIVACDDYNDKFKGLDEVSKPSNVANYEMDYAGTYPTHGYFEGKDEVEDGVGKWLASNFYTCDSASTANISVLVGDIVEGNENEEVNLSYQLADSDYAAMGTDRGEPGKYNNFDSNMDVDFYLTIFLRNKYPYAQNGVTCEVAYLFYDAENKETTTQVRMYKCNGGIWEYYNPHVDTVITSTKVAQMFFNGQSWELKRLIGGTMNVDFASEQVKGYELLYDWVKINKPAYLGSNSGEEFYFGASVKYGNLNNRYTTWREYGIDGEYDNLTNEEMQTIMDSRLADGIIAAILPVVITKPDPGLSYVVIYKVYGGRGDGSYSMSFMYNEETQLYELISDVSKL